MPTPDYIPVDRTHNAAGTTGPSVPEFAQNDVNALQDDLALMGAALGWSEAFTLSAGKIVQSIASQGVYRLKIDYAYVPSGPAVGKIDTETHAWSDDSGSTYKPRLFGAMTLGVLTYSYDGSGFMTATAWS